MNILVPHSWLLEYFKTDLKPAAIAAKLSLSGVSVEKVARVPANLADQIEYIYDIEVTSNRPDVLSVIGVAREAAAVFKKECAFPALFEIPKSDDIMPLHIEIREPALCPRYLGIVLQDIAVKPSPDFIQERLKLAGQRPINNVVDITNYVMLEYGQPLHAFDWDRLEKNKQGEVEIIVRKAAPGEKIITLDKQKFDLEPGMLVVADSAEPIALAGIKGGVKAEVTENTKTIVLECANFNPVSIRQTSHKLSLQTDASVRFDKGLSALGLEIPFGRAIDLLEKFSGGAIASRLIDAYPYKVAPRKIVFNLSTIKRVLGVEIPRLVAQKILLSLGFHIRGRGEKMEVSVPAWRHQDIETEEDLVEEVARIYGYHRLKGKLLDTAMPVEIRPQNFHWEDKTKDILASQGFTEVYTYSFVGRAMLAKFGLDLEKHLCVTNPLSSDFEYMRQTLLPSLLNLVAENQKRYDAIKIFELASIYKGEKMPYEKSRLTGLLVRKKGKINLFYQLKGVLENLLIGLGITDYKFSKPGQRFFHSQAASTLEIQGKNIGMFGLIEPSLARSFQIKEMVFGFDFDFEALLAYVSSHKRYKPIPKYPAVIFDLSIIVPQKTLWQEIRDTVKSTHALIREVELFDVYQSQKMGKAKKSLAFQITYRSDQRSLKEEEIKVVHQKVVSVLKNKFGAIVREG